MTAANPFRYCAAPGCEQTLTGRMGIYCQPHQKAHENEVARVRRLAHKSIVTGTVRQCAVCGVEIVMTSANRLYCHGCARKNNLAKANTRKANFMANYLSPLQMRHEQERAEAPAIAAAKIVLSPEHVVCVIPHKCPRTEREALRMDALIRANKAPGYDKYHPERFIKYVEVTA